MGSGEYGAGEGLLEEGAVPLQRDFQCQSEGAVTHQWSRMCTVFQVTEPQAISQTATTMHQGGNGVHGQGLEHDAEEWDHRFRQFRVGDSVGFCEEETDPMIGIAGIRTAVGFRGLNE